MQGNRRGPGDGYKTNRRLIGAHEVDTGQTGGSKGLRRWLQGKQVDQRDSGVGYKVNRWLIGAQEVDTG